MYSATKNAQGNYDIFKDGAHVSTGSSAVLGNYGLSESQLKSAAPAPTALAAAATPVQPTVTSVPATSTQPPITPKIALPVAVYTTYQNQIKNGQITPEAAASALQNIYNTGLYTDQFDPSKLYTPGLTYTNANNDQVAFDNSNTGNTIKTAATVQNNVVGAGGTSTYSGPSVVDYLASVGQPSDLASRSKLAASYGLVSDPSQFTGSAAQNTALLTALRTHAAGASQSQAGSIAGSTASPTSTGLPGDLSSILGLSSLNPGSPIPASGLSSTNGTNLGSILSAGAGGTAGNNDTIAGLIASLSASTPEDKTYSDLNKQLTDAMSSLGGESTDLQSALNANGVPQTTHQLQALNLEIAQKKAALDQFDTQTQAAISNTEDQAIPLGLVQGQQAAIQKQRNLTKMAMASDLSASVALATAYQGNIDTATKLAEQSVTMKYAPIENQISTLQTQISLAKENMTKADQKNATIINELLSIQSTQIAEAKKNDAAILTQAVNAAANGAPISVINAMKASSDPAAAAHVGAAWLKGNNEKVGSGTGTAAAAKPQFTTTQINSGAAVAGVPTSSFTTLPGNVQNYFINSPNAKSFMKDIQGMNLQQDDPNYISAADIKQNISDSVVPEDVKTYLNTLVDQHAPAGGAGNNGSGILSNIGNFFGGIWNTIKTGATNL